MPVVMSKKKKYFILLFAMLALAATTTGIYLFVNPKTSDSSSYTVNKYSDVVDWCDTNVKDNILSVKCKALLMNIDINGCFEVQVITNGKELKDLTLCEKNDSLSYTNDVLGYKKLMPVEMVFTYTKEGRFGDNSFNNVSFSKADDTYVQNIVNEDVANLVSIPPVISTIKNFVGICPKAESLSKWLTKENQISYLEFIKKNSITRDQYLDNSFNQLNDYLINGFFICKSHDALEYSGICDLTRAKNLHLLPKNIPGLNITENSIKWGNDFDEIDTAYLKEISLLYDNLFLVNNSSSAYLSNMSSLVEALNVKENINESTLCSLSPIYNALTDENPQILKDQQYLDGLIYTNLKEISSPLCGNIIQKKDDIDLAGMYLQIYYKNIANSSFMLIYSKCDNLSILVSNE